MNNTINGLPLPLSPEQVAVLRAHSSAMTSVAGEGNLATQQASSGSAHLKSESLQLTDSAKALQKVQVENVTIPVNIDHVERIRQAIAAGQYETNVERIAEKFLMIERGISENNSRF